MNILHLRYFYDYVLSLCKAYKDYYINDEYLAISGYFYIHNSCFRISSAIENNLIICEKLKEMPNQKNIFIFSN